MFEDKNKIDQIIAFTTKTNAIFINAAGNENYEIQDLANDRLEQKYILIISNTDSLNLKSISSNLLARFFTSAIVSKKKDFIQLFLNLNITITQQIIFALIKQKDQDLMKKICERAESIILENVYKVSFKNKQDEMIKILLDIILKKNPHFNHPLPTTDEDSLQDVF